MEVICLEDKAFYELLEKAVAHLRFAFTKDKEKWVSPTEAMRLLNISSRTTLQKYRDEGRVRFSQDSDRRIILYDRDSINEYLELNAKDTF